VRTFVIEGISALGFKVLINKTRNLFVEAAVWKRFPE